MFTKTFKSAAIAVILGTSVFGLTATETKAIILDMEGVAPAGMNTTEDDTNTVMNGFNLFVSHGHFFDSAEPLAGTVRPTNGTDWLMHDDFGAFTVTKVGGGAFSIQSFDATFRRLTDNGLTDRNHDIILSGILSSGGSISATFTIDDLPSFQTFTVGPGWTSLTSVTFDNPSGVGLTGAKMGYDNIVVEGAENIVPEPGTLALFGLGLAGLGLARRRRAA